MNHGMNLTSVKLDFGHWTKSSGECPDSPSKDEQNQTERQDYVGHTNELAKGMLDPLLLDPQGNVRGYQTGNHVTDDEDNGSRFPCNLEQQLVIDSRQQSLETRETRFTHRSISVNRIRNYDIGSSSRAKTLHAISHSGTAPAILGSNHQSERQQAHRPNDGGDDQCRQSELWLGMLASSRSHSGGNEIDEPAAREEGNGSPNEARD